MHLNFWIRPSVAADLPQPVVSEPAEDRTVYLLPEIRQSKWALVVGSPAPFDRIWAMFDRPLEDVRFVVDTFGVEQPAGTFDLPSGRIASSFFRIEMDGAAPEDLLVAAAIAFVDKSWLEENGIHKWSIEFNRFDDELGAWTPSPSKRIREDEERLFFAVALPGFSTFAITGAQDLPGRVFEVGDLRIGPEPRAGEAVDISADVTNMGLQTAEYPAVLWIDASVEAARSVTVGPGQTATISFAVARPPGTYSIRVDRQLAELTVGPSDTQPPATGGLAPARWLLAVMGAAGLMLMLGGGYITRMRRQPRRG
jgi:PGF-pre-PGF domain-containing protein